MTETKKAAPKKAPAAKKAPAKESPSLGQLEALRARVKSLEDQVDTIVRVVGGAIGVDLRSE